MQKLYKCNLYLYKRSLDDVEQSIRVYYSRDMQVVTRNICFDADDIAAALGEEVKDVTRYLCTKETAVENEHTTISVQVGDIGEGMQVARRKVITEAGVLSVLLSRMQLFVWRRETNEVATELLRWITHVVIPDVIGEAQ